MAHYLFKVLILILFSAFIIFLYYYGSPSHIENFDGYAPYIISMIFIYGAYKFIQVGFGNEKGRVKFSPLSIFSFFLLHLFVLCCIFFYMTGNPLVGGFILFFKILFFSVLPVSIIFISIAFGKKILSILFTHYNFGTFLREEKIFFLLVGLGIGFFSFLFLVACFGVIGFYNLWVVFGILIGFAYFAYHELISLFMSLIDTKYSFELKEGNYIHFLSVEFLFLIATFLLSVNLISIVRPFPIGWDDLGVYMNQPHLFAQAGSLIDFGGIYAWQIFTGIGYLAQSATQAFFFNVVGSFMSFFVLIYVVSDLLKSVKKTFINIPLLVATLFISMPMVVFQQAKDMKLDTGLFFVSVIVVYLLYKTYICFGSTQEIDSTKNIEGGARDNNLSDNNNQGILLSLFFIIGILAGFAFTIKFTSLLLISSIIGVMFFASFGVWAFIGYLSLFFSIFTMGGLWSYLNVVVNPDNISNFETLFSALSAFIGLFFLGFSIYALHKKDGIIQLKKFLARLLIFLLGIFISLIPWAGKNIVTSYPDISIGTILSGKSASFEFDLSKMYGEDELRIIDEGIDNRRMSSSGTIADEDLGRYFGYEKGITNYVKLPWNLTMQTNQGGEFTNIGFFFLALLPTLLLFLPYRKRYMAYGVGVFLILEVLIFRFDFFANFMGYFSLPLGYGIILGLFLFPLFYFLYFLDTSKKFIRLFQLNLIFAIFYTFLWMISAFGIVWYGIVMYFSFLLMIAIGGYYIVSYDKDLDISSKDFLIKGFGSLCLFGVLFIYFTQSVFPHSFTNLKRAGYSNYKLSKISKYEAPFLYHKEYLPMLFHLNISEDKRKDFIHNSLASDQMREFISQNKGGENISFIVGILRQLIKSEETPSNVKQDGKRSLYNIYRGILSAKEEYQNKEGIYRIGTFLKYHILENHTRLLEDSLIFSFDDYIYNEDSGITIDNMKKLGLRYLLVDLNAATIDKDSRRNLTGRYERLLSTFPSDQLELIETDSVCLKVALEKYATDDNIEEYMSLAGVNFDSYTFDENGESKVIARGEKLMGCYKHIHSLIKNNQVSNSSYSYLLPHVDYIKTHPELLDSDSKVISFLHTQLGKSFKVLFRIKE